MMKLASSSFIQICNHFKSLLIDVPIHLRTTIDVKKEIIYPNYPHIHIA